MTGRNISNRGRRIWISLYSMLIIIAVLVIAIILFVSFGKGPSWQRGVAGIMLTFLTFFLAWMSMDHGYAVRSTWTGIFSGMAAWMVLGEISHQFGFVMIENEGGLILLLFFTAFVAILWIRKRISWGIKVCASSFLLNWWGHSILLSQLYLAEETGRHIFHSTLMGTGVICLVAVVGLFVHIVRKPAPKERLVYYGLWLYALLVTGIEGTTCVTSKMLGH